MYNLDSKLHFGKYQGYTVREIYCGPKRISQSFLNDFLELKLKEKAIFVNEWSREQKLGVEVRISSFEVLINNEVFLDLTFDKNKYKDVIDQNTLEAYALDRINWDLILDDRPEAKDIFEKPNDAILQINKSKSVFHQISSDANYISWCIRNLDTFFLDPEDLTRLENENCRHFYGVSLLSELIDNGVFKFSVNLVSTTYKFDDEVLGINNEKFDNFFCDPHPSGVHNKRSPDYSHVDDPQYPDGYGGYHDNDMIDDVFEGNPDNYWNVD